MRRLTNKIVILTGATGGMGEAHARRFVSEGARLVLTDIDLHKGERLAAELGANARFLRHDVSSPEDWAKVVSFAEREFGPVNVLVNNAAITVSANLEDCSLETYQKVVAVNQIGVFLGMKAVIGSMRRAGGGSIINISSTAGLVGSRGVIGYCDTKFALRGMSKVAALELGPDKIRVNTVHPGGVLTPMLLNHPSRQRIEANAKTIALGRFGEPEEIAHLVLFLASDESSYSTGSEFIADGGLVAE